MHDYYMKEAIKEAHKALMINEVPVGCVIVKDNKIIGRGYNTRERLNNSLCHAEIIAINEACKNINDWRLTDCSIYVTLEPCPMCAGAIIQSRIKYLVFGANDKNTGCAGSVIDLFNYKQFNNYTYIFAGILEDECSNLLKKYFKEIRE